MVWSWPYHAALTLVPFQTQCWGTAFCTILHNVRNYYLLDSTLARLASHLLPVYAGAESENQPTYQNRKA